MHIYITRHGESEYNVEDRIGGNPPLTRKGEDYAESLKTYFDTLTVNTVYCSTKLRTMQTMFPLLDRKLDVRMRPDLEEIDAGVCEGMTYSEMSKVYPEEYDARKKDKLGYRYKNGESYHDIIARVEIVTSEIQKEDVDVLVVCHRAIARGMLVQLGVIAEEEAPCFDVPLNTVIVVDTNNKTVKKIGI